MPANSTELNRIFTMVAPYVFPLIWVGACFLFSRLSGWSRLADHYKAAYSIPAEDSTATWTPFYATLGRVESKNVIKIGANRHGIFLKVFILFRLFHPTLFIPWKDIRCTPQGNSFFGIKNEMVELREF